MTRLDAIKQIKTVDKAAQGKLTRREFNRALGVFGVSTVAMPMMARPALSAGEVLYFTWAGWEDPKLFPAYMGKYGAPDATFFNDEYEAIEKLRAGFKADVVSPCIDVMPRWMGADLLPLDESRISHLGDTFEVLRSPDAAFRDGERYFVPHFWGFNSFVYRTDMVDFGSDEESWAALFDERYKGKISVWDSTDAVIPIASLVLGFTDDPYKPTGERLERVAELLRKQRELVRFYWGSATEALQALMAGEVAISFAWTLFHSEIKDAPVPLKWATPKEGQLSFNCGLALGNRTRDAAASHEFIDACMAPEAGKYMIEEFNYGHCNKKSFDLADPELLTMLHLSSPEDALNRGHAYDYVPPEIKNEHIALFDEIKAGY